MSNKQSDNIEVERDELPLGTLFGYLVGICAVAVLILILVWTYYKSATGDLMTTRQQTRKDAVLEEAKATDKAALNSYVEVDRVKGLYRIPIERAIDLLAANPALLEPIELPKKPTTAPATAPAAAAGDETKAQPTPAPARPPQPAGGTTP